MLMRRPIFFAIVLLLLAACAPAAPDSGDSLSVWLDAPLDGSQFPPGAIEIIGHASGVEGIQSLELSLDGEVLKSQAVNAAPGALASISFTWQADSPGVHSVSLRASAASGFGPRADALITILGDDAPLRATNTPASLGQSALVTPTPPSLVDNLPAADVTVSNTPASLGQPSLASNTPSLIDLLPSGQITITNTPVALGRATATPAPVTPTPVTTSTTRPTNTTAPGQPSPTPAHTPTRTPAPSAGCTNKATFVSETIADGTQFAPGASFTKTWTIVNAGTCTWGAGYQLVFAGGSRMGAPITMALPASVPPNGQVTLSLALTSPANPGSYQGNWMLANSAGVQFGVGAGGQTPIWVQIEVVSAAAPTSPPDTRAPSVTVTYQPNGRGLPDSRQEITLTATAADNVAVTRIDIFFYASNGTETRVGLCRNVTICEVIIGPFAVGDYVLYARARDAVGNETTTPVQNIHVFAVVN